MNRRQDRTSSVPSNENMIADLKAALMHTGSRHSYAVFSKLIESVDEKNIHPVLAFVQSGPKDEKSAMLLELLVGRWVEFDFQAAIRLRPECASWVLPEIRC